MASPQAQDLLPRRSDYRLTKRSERTGIGEIPFFLDVPAAPGVDDVEERERALEDLDREMKP